jgi:hypothetical protein
MKSMKICIVIVSLFLMKVTYAQKPDSVLKSITRAIEKSIARGRDDKHCKEFESAIFSIFITFSQEAKVEDIIFSDSPNCFLHAKENIERYLINNIDSLKLEGEHYANKFILAVIYILPAKRDKTTLNNIPDSWEFLFSGIEVERLKGKNMLYSIPVAMYILPSIRNSKLRQ